MSSRLTPTASHTVAAGALVNGRRVLLCHRRPDRSWYPDVWDLVGGHVEPGESAHAALVRECREELAIEVLHAEPIPVDTGDPLVEMALFIVRSWRSEPMNAAPEEHDSIAWFDRTGLASAPLTSPRYRALLSGLLDK